MLCDRGVCKNCAMKNFSASRGILALDNDFCIRLRHIKCKVAQLAREQMKKKTAVSNNAAAGYVYQSRHTIQSNTPRDVSRDSSTLRGVSRGTSSFDSEMSVENSSAFEDRSTQIQTDGVDSNHSVDVTSPTPRVEHNTNETLLEAKPPPLIPRQMIATPGYGNSVPGAKFFGSWIKYISEYFTKRLRVLLVAVIIGILIWMALVYGAIIGASLCNSGQYPSFQFSSSRTRASVF